MKRALLALIGVGAVAIAPTVFAHDVQIGAHVFVPAPRIFLPPAVLLPIGISYGGAGDYYDGWRNERNEWHGRDHDDYRWHRYEHEHYRYDDRGYRDHGRHDWDRHDHYREHRR